MHRLVPQSMALDVNAQKPNGMVSSSTVHSPSAFQLTNYPYTMTAPPFPSTVDHRYVIVNQTLSSNIIMKTPDFIVTKCDEPPVQAPALVGRIETATDHHKEFECQWGECSVIFPSLECLVQHINDCHLKANPDYKCQWRGCKRRGRTFNARYKILVHVRTHTNEKPHSCSMCGKCFSRLENLKIHTRSHTGEKPYVCPVKGCGKAYSNSSDRFKHVRTHQYAKPYQCRYPGCEKSYTDPSSLRKHIKNLGHHFRDEENADSNSIVEKTESIKTVICQDSPLDLTVSQFPSGSVQTAS